MWEDREERFPGPSLMAPGFFSASCLRPCDFSLLLPALAVSGRWCRLKDCLTCSCGIHAGQWSSGWMPFTLPKMLTSMLLLVKTPRRETQGAMCRIKLIHYINGIQFFCVSLQITSHLYKKLSVSSLWQHSSSLYTKAVFILIHGHCENIASTFQINQQLELQYPILVPLLRLQNTLPYKQPHWRVYSNTCDHGDRM